MALIACKNRQAMHFGCRGDRNVLESWLMRAGTIKDQSCGMRCAQIERQYPFAIKMFNCLPPLTK
ncbi:hypothetical protein SAMN03159463_02162 [Mesorhizobium sp. NFR06]|nr:hypothetical protein SAMN03159463_02162 [Mesorhizobium sp. NFR06]